MEDVEETLQAPVARMLAAVARVFRQVQRQRPVRPEQAEEAHVQFRRRLVGGGREARQARRRERERGLLSEPHGFVGRAQRAADARTLRIEALQLPHQMQEVVRVGLAFERGEQRFRGARGSRHGAALTGSRAGRIAGSNA